MRVLLTGSAGFIGFHTAKALLEQGAEIFGLDSVNDYYDPSFKERRIEFLSNFDKFSFTRGQLEDKEGLQQLWDKAQPEVVINLAAQAGVRYSLENPDAYIQANVVGFQNLIDLARERKPKNFVYASSSSVYGGNKEMPFSESQDVRNPISLYAATKLSNELVAKSYSNLFELNTIGLRFFTVYGPFSRPDMAMFKFAELMRQGKAIPVYNHGKMVRDFTYIEDIVQGVIACAKNPMLGEVFNLGRGEQADLMAMIEYLEEGIGIKAEKDMYPMQLGDVPATLADISKAGKLLGYKPATSLREGVEKFSAWYREFRNL